jgi:trimeric autotransporter adhesin
MRRFLTLVGLLCLAIPAGISVSGCTRNPDANYCNGLGYGQKITDVASINLQPQTTGISLAFGQTQQIAGPTAKTCKGAAASVTTYTYGTTNNQLVDISPTGNLCAGTWNRNTGGGIANYTYCNNPDPMPSSGGLPYGSAFITAEASGVTSNPVQVFIHPHVTAVALAGPTSCVSQSFEYADSSGNPLPLDAQACYAAPGNLQYELCAPASITQANNPSLLSCRNGKPPSVAAISDIPTCPNAIGTLSFNVVNGAIASINPVNNEITAEQPGTTAITASIAGSGSSAGYFSTCPPKSISVTLANGSTSGTITQGVQQNLVTTIVDTRGNPITGVTLDYQSTNPLDTQASATGGLTASFPGTASIYAVCQPIDCNPSPINTVGLNATGLSLSSNPVTVTTPGTASAYVWFAAPGKSQYFVPIELLSGTAASTVRLPYVPNSMIMDQLGTNLYFGSAHELMIYSTTTNSLSKEDPTVPGVVLAVAPNNSELLINDQARHVFYIYNSSGTVAATFGGMGNAAAWTPDAKTLYIVDNANLNSPTASLGTGSCPSTQLITGHTDTLYAYNVNSGWTTYSLPPSPLPAAALPTCQTKPNTYYTAVSQTPAIMNPSVGAYFGRKPTVAHTYCPVGTASQTTAAGTSTADISLFYPPGDSVDVQTDSLTATTDGKHILGAALGASGIELSDIGILSTTPLTDPCPENGTALGALAIDHSLTQTAVTANATAVNQVVSSPPPTLINGSTSQASSFAFVTYDGNTAGATLPYYIPSATAGTAGTLGYVTLKGASSITAPLVGAFSPDNSLFFVSTAGDNQIHYIKIPTTATGAPADSQQFSPNLPACVPQSASDPYCTNPTGTSPSSFVPATAIAVKPRNTT